MRPAIAVPSSDLQLVSGAGSEIVDGVVTMVSLILIYEERKNIIWQIRSEYITWRLHDQY